MLKSNITKVDSLIRTAEEAKLLRTPLIQNSIKAVLASDDNKLAEHIQRFLQFRAGNERLLQYPFEQYLEKPVSPNLSGQRKIIVGIIQRINQPLIYLLDLLVMHCLVLGASGTGKTNLFYGLIAQCIKHGVNVLIFDKDKQDYRHLLRLFNELPVFDAAKDFIFNPWQVPSSVSPDHWLAASVQIFCKCNSLLDGSESLLLKAMVFLYEKFGVFQNSGKFPTMIDLYEKIKNYNFKGFRSKGYQESIINRLEAYISLHRNIYEYEQGIPIDWIAQNSMVLEVKGLTDRVARFNATLLLYALFMHRLAKNERGNILRNLAVIDEAKWLAPPGYNEASGFSVLTNIMAMAREVGLGLMLGDQSAQLEDSVFVNSRIKCCFRLGDGQDIEKVKHAMSLTEEQARYITRLGTGECIIRIPGEEPFVINTLKVNLG